MKDLLSQLDQGIVLLSDGATGTELQKRGLPPGSCPEEYILSHPEVVQEVHRDYIDAGADFIETNSFGANRSRLAMHGLEHRVAELCRTSATLAREVCPEGRYVAGSIGPTGDILEPLGSRSLDDAFSLFAEPAEALAEGGVDVIFVETMMSVEEAEIAVKAAKERTNLPIAATMTFEMGKSGLRTIWGVDVQTAVHRLTDAGADILGSNCGRGFEDMIAVASEMRPLTRKPILAQPNAGIPEWIDAGAVYPETPESVGPKVSELLKLGVNIVGGCCGTGPAHIMAMRQLIDTQSIQRGRSEK